jgi:predicted RNase H-like nuclease (RuvC/YqgF family)
MKRRGVHVVERTDDKPPDEALNECEEKIEELQEENAQLRNAAETFGNLAERLNAERRSGADRRQHTRSGKSGQKSA